MRRSAVLPIAVFALLGCSEPTSDPKPIDSSPDTGSAADVVDAPDAAAGADTSRADVGVVDIGTPTDMNDAGSRLDAGTDLGTDMAVPCNAPAWECILERAGGFGGAVTGGAGGPLCWVNNLNANGPESLRSCLNLAGPKWVVFSVSGTIDGDIEIPSDTTIDGRGQRIEIRGGNSHSVTTAPNASNIFVTNLIIADSGNDLIHTWDSSSDIWLDHLTLVNGGDEALGLDGPNTTVSWCHITDSTYGILIGGAAREYPALYVTVHHTLFERNSERHPRGRGRVHTYNNFIDFGRSGARFSQNGQLQSERNIYTTARPDGVAIISRAGGAVVVPGFFRSVDDVLQGNAVIDNDNDPTPVFDPSTFYPYTTDAPDVLLEARLRAEAGWQDIGLPM